MQAKITKIDGYMCAPEGHTVQTFALGRIVSGPVAEMAVADGAAEALTEGAQGRETKVERVPEVKRRRRGR